jgi:hypothetical protein
MKNLTTHTEAPSLIEQVITLQNENLQLESDIYQLKIKISDLNIAILKASFYLTKF